MTISGGTIVAVGSSQPETTFDCDNNTLKITGGTLIGIAGSTSTPTSSASTQHSLVYEKPGTFELSHIESASGQNVLTFKAPRTYSQTVILFSSPNLKPNTSYIIYSGGSVSGGSVSGGNEFHGLYEKGTYIKRTTESTFTVNSMITTVGFVSRNLGGGRP